MIRLLTIFVIVLILLLFLYYFFPDLTIYMSIENIKTTHNQWVVLYQENPYKIVLYFMLFNASLAMLPIPGISMISFLGGSIFGFLPGVLYSSLATAIGNLGGFFIARYFLHDYIYKRFGDKLRIFNNDFQVEGIMALFSFRLFPFIPSFVANLIMGVSSLNWWSFFWVSWVGRIPMVLVYTWSGVQIANIKNTEDILRPKIAVVFILIAVLPWFLRFLMNHYKKVKI